MERPLTEYRFLHRLAELPFVQAIWLFGSRARGTARERSDIDLAILCPEATVLDWDRVMQIVEEADTLLEIDAVRFDRLPVHTSLHDSILRDRRILFERVPA
ncbi:nucleotidyltransferase domain-containing protein [Paracraurococcus lichenis]|uniref:Nucleotidyltransferase domain-containing protein n=1 Tax=Paracraurococcus lichenis TaxID=3064888 RepID=A0ABT9E665_9PROT|nr:nucleotidyltransferase domain-containing protein [Paracraurococcus sp. LOR1-02]MDO9711658.1 nucleotidyltransferase domain-containing protein [Paracraurococcus sp. LOR1-02]